MAEPFVVASNRGPLKFSRDENGELESARGAGGLISGIGPLVQDTDTTWVAAAMSDTDRELAQEGVTEADGFRVCFVDVEPRVFHAAYDVVCNGVLWYVHHAMFDRPRQPRFGPEFADAWQSYRQLNQQFAAAVASIAPDGSTVLVQDYHLALAGRMLRDERPDLRTVHFAHTPFAGPDEFAVLPPAYRDELIAGLTANTACVFHTERWATNFRASVQATTGADPECGVLTSPLGTDPDDLTEVGRSDACATALHRLVELVGDRMVVARVDRVEPSKNLVRGFEAYGLFLEQHPEWHDRVVFVASVYKSRERVAAYRAYAAEVTAMVDAVNARFRTATWEPILFDTSDDYPRSVATLRRYDVLLVNAVRDGLNLVASEGPTVNERDGELLLSTETGISELLGDAATRIHPFDISGTADAIHRALTRPPEERRERASALRDELAKRTPNDWLDDQLAAASTSN